MTRASQALAAGGGHAAWSRSASSTNSFAALGCRAHSGWAVLVAVGGPPRAPAVIHRSRIELVARGLPLQPYHAAKGLQLSEAARLIQRSTETAQSQARRSYEAVIEELRRQGSEVVASGVLLSSGLSLPPLPAILASHALIHTAEGELFRKALLHASERCHLPLTAVRERELEAQAAAQLGIAPAELQSRLRELGRSIGPPWRLDEKLAALVAWLALQGAGENRVGRIAGTPR